VENLCDLSIPKTFSPQNQATPILFRQHTHHGQNALPPLAGGYLVLWVLVRIGHQIRREWSFICHWLSANACLIPPLQGQIVGDAERPGPEIAAGSAVLQVPEQ
jgi:hypothetical protein